MPRWSLALLACAVGCTPVPPAAPAPRTPTVVNASFGRTWDAVIDAFATRGISIETLDRSSGLIVPAGRTYLEQDAEAAAPFVDCGKNVLGMTTAPASVKYNVIVRGDSARATVQVRAFYKSVVDRECSSTGRFEASTEESIKAKAEGGT